MNKKTYRPPFAEVVEMTVIGIICDSSDPILIDSEFGTVINEGFEQEEYIW